jgi:hypothetical protein
MGSDCPGSRIRGPKGADPLRERVRRWQSVRSWACLIREAEALWHVDARLLHRLAAEELVRLVQEVPPRLRRRVNRWLERFHVATRLH